MISVILPTFNSANTISEAVKSIIDQTYNKFELIIINDGSTDNTYKVIESIHDQRIRYYEKEHSGLADSLNYGIKKANYDLIARMDADDISMPIRFEAQLKYIGEYDIVSCSYIAFKKNKIKFAIDLPEDHIDIIKTLMLHSVVCHPAVIFKKDVVVTLGGYNGSNSTCDYDLWCRSTKYFRFKNIPDYLHLYRLHDNSISADYLKMKAETYKIQNKYFSPSILKQNIESELEINRLLGWREYFYGEKNKAREYWSSHLIAKGLKKTIAVIFTYLPQVIFDYLINKKVSLRYKYYVQLFNKRDQTAKGYLKKMN